MLRSEAVTYIARALSGSSDTDRQAQALDSLSAAVAEWNIRHDWSWLLMDTSGGFTVAACTNAAGTLTTSTTDGFAGVNVGQTATGSAIGTVTVTAVNSTTSLTVTGGASAGPETLTFSANIPVRAGTDSYRLPTPVKRIYSVRTTLNPQPLEFKEQREIDRMFSDLTAGGIPYYYNIFNTVAFGTTTQNGRIRLFPIPSGADTLIVRYHKPIEVPADASDTLVVPDRYLYALLELGRYYFLHDLDTENPRTGEAKDKSEFMLRKCIRDDMRSTGDNDARLISQMDHMQRRSVDILDSTPMI